MQKRLIFILLLLSAALTGCIKPYTPSVQQGNIITAENVANLKLGMSEDDVQYALGEPVLQSTFNNDQWDYIYTYQPKDNGPVEEKRVSLFFNSQKNLVKIDANLTPQHIK
ncbi:MAG: outer membrane protein assembly factor BamE [Gammaproteobacteria bacterium]|nr:outer membrane protein assembly factor BamE [Gammaproteobacteria bacterium]